jgi:DNA-binding response OmpR family regulator
MSGQTIVVIEDEATIAGAIAARLRSEGFRVAVAGTGPEGVDLCHRTAPDLVVLDWMLPGFDGIEACRRIQADRPVAVLFLTARDAEADVLVGLGIGADDYVTKPFSPRELVARVHAVLRRSARAAAREPVAAAPPAPDHPPHPRRPPSPRSPSPAAPSSWTSRRGGSARPTAPTSG